jgi:hypothetical protein
MRSFKVKASARRIDGELDGVAKRIVGGFFDGDRRFFYGGYDLAGGINDGG